MNVQDYIYITNLLSKSLCDDLIQAIDAKEWNKHTWYSNSENTITSESEKELDVQHADEELNNRVAPFIVEAGKQYNNKYAVPGTKTRQFISRFTGGRFNRYESGTLMRKHYDHIHSIFDGNDKGIPVLSILALLNDDFEGGEFLVND